MGKEKKGRSFERTIRLIQESFGEVPNVQVHSNYLIKSQTGRKREIDVLIIGRINGFEIKIAIECKDYSRRVQNRDIESFNSKCDQIRDINKRVFVSSSGYQSGAIESANFFGIELLQTKDLSQEMIFSWLPVKKLGLRFIPPLINTTVFLDTEDEDYLAEVYQDFDQKIYFGALDSVTTMFDLLNSSIEENKSSIWNTGLLEWIQRKKDDKFTPIIVPFDLTFKDTFILDGNKQKIGLKGIHSSIKLQFFEEGARVKDAKELLGLNGELKAKTISIDLGGGVSSEIIENKNRMNFYVTNKMGVTEQLKELLSYDPKTGLFTEKNG